MDSHQGADFTFLNMDYSHVFATKPNEGETSNSFFFGDEGIDTTASMMDPILFPQQTAFDMQQDFTLDNTSGSASVWNGTHTPQIHTIDMFPPTPTHSFDSTYQPDFSTLGKRGLQLDADLPQAKRHEAADFTTGSLFSPMLPSSTTLSWALDAQNTPAPSVEVGISDEAADMCATWFNKYAILPSDRHIDSLSQLTGEPADAIRHWFGRLMKQGMGTTQGDSAYKSQTALQQAEQFWSSFEVPQLPLEESTQESMTSPVAHEAVTVSPTAPTNTLRGGKKSRCAPTDDRSLLSRDANKIYQCTRKCGKRYGRKCDWKRNEEEGYPCKSWVCSLCTSEGVDNVKPCFRKYHFAQHFRNIHPGVNCDEYEEASVVCSETEFPRKCGFCKHRFQSRQERIDHIAEHFKQGKCMLDWNDSEDGQDSENTDDDDDKPSDDGSDGSRPPYQPPQRDPRGGSDPKYSQGGSDSHNGGSGGPSQGGFFQFQLSQLSSHYNIASSSDSQWIKTTSDPPQTQQRTRCASEPLYERSIDQPSTVGQRYTRDSVDAPKGDNADALARDDVSGLVATSTLQEPQQQIQTGVRALRPRSSTLQRSIDDFWAKFTTKHPGKNLAIIPDNLCAKRAATGELASTSGSHKERPRVLAVEPSARVDIAEHKTDWLEALLSSRKHMTLSQARSASPGDPVRNLVTVEQTAPVAESLKTRKLDETEFTRIDDIVASRGIASSDVLPRDSNPRSSGPSSLETKVMALAKPRTACRQLTPSQLLQTIATTPQSFLSVRFLGSGGFSTVDEVVHRETKLRMGRKTLNNRSPAAIKELWKEVNVLQKLRHPHVIRFLGAYSKGDKMSMLLSPIADTTLALWLDRHKHSQPANFSHVITKMFGCLASSVRYLHEQRPVVKHMDIKPQNILIVEGDGEFPHVVLCDFGISSSDDITEGRTQQPLTRQYVAPEAFEGFIRKEAADIWSLGCVFAEMASVSFSQGNSSWTDLRQEFSGRATKYYWQDVPGLQSRLSGLLEAAATSTENTVVRTLQSMLNVEPDERPDATALTMIFTPAPCCLSWPNDKAAYPSPQEELSSVEMITLEGGIETDAQLRQHGQAHAGPEQGLSSAKNWIQQCSHSHSACSHATPSHAKALPTRLVDIRPEGQAATSIRIVDSSTIAPGTEPIEYLALSHVWSSSDVLLTTSLLQASATEVTILLSTLSLALNAAIASAQRLGYSYLWTDTLCVLQDSAADKRHECTNMASTFRNAALTLLLDNIDTNMTDFMASLSTRQDNSGFAWDTRAWALQERLLSHRFLHLGQEQMYWECNSLKASETFPMGLPSLLWEKAHTKPDNARGMKLGKLDRLVVNAAQGHDRNRHADIKPENVLRFLDANPRTHATPKRSSRPVRNSQYIRKDDDSMQVPRASMNTEAHATNAPLSSSHHDRANEESYPASTSSTVPYIRKGNIFATAQGNVKSKIGGNEGGWERRGDLGREIFESGLVDRNGDRSMSVSRRRVNGNARTVDANRTGGTWIEEDGEGGREE